MSLIIDALTLAQKLDEKGLSKYADALDEFASTLLEEGEFFSKEDIASLEDKLMSYYLEDGLSNREAADLTSETIQELKEDTYLLI